MERNITVTGTAAAAKAPDTVVVTLETECKNALYGAALSAAAESTEKLKTAVVSAGFNGKDLKTERMDVSTHYENYRDAEGNYKTRFDGYICKQRMSVTFPFDNTKLAAALDAVTQTDAAPRIEVGFQVKDKHSVINGLLRSASEDALKKAEILASSFGCTLGALINVSYGRSPAGFTSGSEMSIAPRGAQTLCAVNAVPEITPAEAKFTAEVVCVWQLL